MRSISLTLIWPPLLLALAGCVQGSTPRLDARFGEATRQALAQQVIDPAAAGNAAPPHGIDGASARAVMERYRASFAEPNGQAPAPVSFMLGGSGGK